MVEAHLIAPVYTLPSQSPFHKWYDDNAHYDYHAKNSGHSTENCTLLKYKVQELIKVGKLNFEYLNQPKENGDPSSNSSQHQNQYLE